MYFLHQVNLVKTQERNQMKKWKTIVLILLFAIPLSANSRGNTSLPIIDATLHNWRVARIQLKEVISLQEIKKWKIVPERRIKRFTRRGKHGTTIDLMVEKQFDLTRHYYLITSRGDSLFLRPDGILDQLVSHQPLGYHIEGDSITFRLFAPRAKWVKIVHFTNYRQMAGNSHLMKRDDDGTWWFRAPNSWLGSYYGYRVWGATGEGEMFDSTLVLADPYSPAVVTLNHYTHPGKTIILPPDTFVWQDTEFRPPAWRDLIIYEMHIRDLTAHPTSGLPDGKRGYYRSLWQEPQEGGLPYIRSLGVNAVELLPAQDFGNREVPYRDSTAPVFNTWNPYARNHWGYMTSYFLAPESYYASGNNMEEGFYCGADGSQVQEFKEMVQAFHRNGIAVLMDVVYNHVSQYDYNPLKYIDKYYYFRVNPDGSFTSVSGCGNDLKTERPMARRLIVDSVVHWLREYHVDGFRFDLANMIDRETVKAITRAAQQIKPGVILIAEPWGGGYDPSGFSEHGWAAWNDQFRNGVKGQNPHNGFGFIFGHWQGSNSVTSLQRYITGSLREFGGQFRQASHSVNYLESHDDYTLGDFIRIGLGEVDEKQRITDIDAHARLSSAQLRLNKLAALFLLTSQGMVMLHEGQEYARSKVIVKTEAPDTNWGRIDHNSYNKDNATNYLNFRHSRMNRELVEYYRGLIALRRQHSAFRRAQPNDFQFYSQENPLHIVYRLSYGGKQYLVLMNGDPQHRLEFSTPPGAWGVLVDSHRASAKVWRRIAKNVVTVPATSGMVLEKVEK